MDKWRQDERASLPLCHLALISLALPSELHLQATALASLGLAVILAALPFFFSGVVIAVALTQTPLPTGRVYGVDLVGASLGCLAAVGLLGFLDPSTICLLLGALAGAAAAAFCLATGRRVPRLVLAFAVALAALAGVNGVSYPHLVRVTRMHGWVVPERGVLLDRWNSHSRVIAWRLGVGSPLFWGRGSSPLAATAPAVESIGIQLQQSLPR